MEPPDETPQPPERQHSERPARRRRGRVIAAVVAMVVLVGGGLFAALFESDSTVSPPLVDRTFQPAPSFSLPDVFTPSRSLSPAAFGGKDLVVNFWASWCGPCKAEMPLLEAAYRAEHGRVNFLGIDTNDTRGAAITFLAKVGVTYPSVSDAHGAVASTYHLFGMPTTVFISSTGTMLGRHIGQLNAATLRSGLQEAFGIKGAS